jgi:hypothetical protein
MLRWHHWRLINGTAVWSRQERGASAVPGLIELTRTSPVVATVAAVLLMIIGILFIIYPTLVAWIAGIGLVLAGIAILVSVFLPNDRISS